MDLWSSRQLQLVAAGSLCFCIGFGIRSAIAQPRRGGVVPSPAKTLLPRLSKEELSKLPYPPDALPGARDVDSPLGSLRVYEFGPEDGRKVLLIHGISTPCLALGGVANRLAEKGCRVMLFDLPGRGYSDVPTDIDHDIRLFTSAIFIVLASSQLSWTGAKEGFSIVGYSLGGGIAAAFTSYFPDLIRSLVLIAPAGLIRDRHISRRSRMIYAETALFEPILLRIVRSRLRKPVEEPEKEQPDPEEDLGAKTAVQAEINLEGNQRTVLSKKHPDITIEAAVNHQIDNHKGFVAAFMSSIRYGPIQRQHELWRRVGQSLGAKGTKALIILGERDPIINAAEIQEDANEVLAGRTKFVIMDAGHEAPVAKGPETADHIWAFWQE